MNTGKTQAKFVLPRGLNIPPDTVVMFKSRPLQLVTAYKYLGVFLDNRLSWEAQILRKHVARKVSQKIGLVTRWSATDVTYKTIILHGHHCCRHLIWFKRLLFVTFHRIEGKANSPLEAWCPSNLQSSTVDAISSPLPAT